MDLIGHFLSLFASNLLPMFLLIGTGALLQWRFQLDINSLNKINIYAFVPGLLFAKLLEADIELGAAGSVVGVYGLCTLALLGLTWAGSRCVGEARDADRAVALGATFANTGNYGIPLMTLVFGAEGVVYQSIVLMCNNVIMYTIGLYVIAHEASAGKTLKRILSVPIIYVMALACLIRGTGVVLPEPVLLYARYLGDGLVPVALLTLGAQLVAAKLERDRPTVMLAAGMKLLLAPAVMAVIVWAGSATGLLSWGSVPAKVLILGAGAPAAVNSVIITMEFKARPDIAAGNVLLSTLASAATIPVLMILLRV